MSILMPSFMGAFAEFERSLIRERSGNCLGGAAQSLQGTEEDPVTRGLAVHLLKAEFAVPRRYGVSVRWCVGILPLS
jgi:DNA invertase Pin-like site-specific DNA recombinase